MVQRPPDDQDPTAEEELPEFDGAATDSLDDTYRFHGVAASEPQWKWITELSGEAAAASETFDQLRALDNPALALESEETASPPERLGRTGFDPYATGAFVKPKTRP
jgi:hypothetical protein